MLQMKVIRHLKALGKDSLRYVWVCAGLVVVFSALFPLFLSVTSGTASAATCTGAKAPNGNYGANTVMPESDYTATWQDATTIQFSTDLSKIPGGFITPTCHTLAESTAPDNGIVTNGTFVDGDPYDKNDTYSLQGGDSCTSKDEITAHGAAYPGFATGTAHIYYTDIGNGNCDSYSFNIGNITDTTAGQTLFQWTGTNQITSLDKSNTVLTVTANGTQTFTATTSNPDVNKIGGSQTCTFDITVEADNKTVEAGNVPPDLDCRDKSTWYSVCIGTCGETFGPATFYVKGSRTDPTPITNPGGGGGSGNAAGATSPTINCHVSFNPLSWILCPLAAGFEGLASALDNAINSALTISTDGWNNYYYAWSSIRDISLGLIVIAGLAAIISQAGGFEFLDAYTIRKALPRIVIVAIGISISWPVLKEFVQFTNDLGNGVRSLIYLGAENADGGISHVDLAGGGQAVVAIIAALALSSLGVGFVGLLSFAGTAVLAASVAFLVLILRQMIIVMLVIFSPVAMACYVLPHTQRVWKLWWDSFSKGLLMFPLIAGLIAMGRVFAAVSSANNRTANGFTGAVWEIISFVSYFAPYFLIPFTFRLAGGAIANIGGFVNDRHRGAFDGLRNFRKNEAKKRRQKAVRKATTTGVFKHAPTGSIRSGINRGVMSAAVVNQSGFNPTMMAANIRAARTKNELQHLGEATEHSTALKAFANDDTMLEAAQAGDLTSAETRRYLQNHGNYSERELNTNVALIEQARGDIGREGLALAASVANAGTGSGNAEGSGQMLDSILRASGGNVEVAKAAYGMARGRAEQARRTDLLGGGFADGLAHMQMINDATTPADRAAAIDQANVQGADMTLETQGINAVMGARGQAARNLAPAMQRRLQRSKDAVIQSAATGYANVVRYNEDGTTRTERIDAPQAQREWIQNMASTSAAIDVATSAAPEIARLMADTVHNGRIDLTTLPPNLRDLLATNADGTRTLAPEISVSEAMSKLESQEAYGQIKKVYVNQSQAAASALGMPAPGITPPTPPTPTAGP
jgi:hypothetical protein